MAPSSKPAGKRMPKYRQVKHSLLERIARRQYTESRAVPSEQVLAKELKVAPMTVWRAMKELVAEGVLVRRVGRGTFVRSMAAGRPEGPPDASVALRRIGVVHPCEWAQLRDNPVYFMTFLEIQSECARRGIGLEFLPIPPGMAERAVIRLVKDSDCQAVAAFNSSGYDLLVALCTAGVLRLIEDLVGGRSDSPVGMVLPMNIVEGATARRAG